MGEEPTCEGGKEEPLDLTLCWSGYLLELKKTPLGLGDGLWLPVEVRIAVTCKGDT